MPELPEVETIRRQLEPRLVGAGVVEAWAFRSAKFTDAPAAVGHRVTGLRRRGKYLLADLTPLGTADGVDRELVVHLGMTGRLELTDHPTGSPHLRARWWLDDGRVLSFVDVRRFGRIAVVPTGEHRGLPTLAALGPEPFDETFTPEHLRRAVNASRRAVKTQLLAQRCVAGVGNIYADEALWRAGVHPRSRRLTRADALALRDAVRDVLDQGLADGGTTLRDYRDADGSSGSHQHRLDCYGRWGQPCRRCGTELLRIEVDARTTTFCPACQRRR